MYTLHVVQDRRWRDNSSYFLCTVFVQNASRTAKITYKSQPRRPLPTYGNAVLVDVTISTVPKALWIVICNNITATVNGELGFE